MLELIIVARTVGTAVTGSGVMNIIIQSSITVYPGVRTESYSTI